MFDIVQTHYIITAISNFEFRVNHIPSQNDLSSQSHYNNTDDIEVGIRVCI